jgi:hypothetical protein
VEKAGVEKRVGNLSLVPDEIMAKCREVCEGP